MDDGRDVGTVSYHSIKGRRGTWAEVPPIDGFLKRMIGYDSSPLNVLIRISIVILCSPLWNGNSCVSWQFKTQKNLQKDRSRKKTKDIHVACGPSAHLPRSHQSRRTAAKNDTSATYHLCVSGFLTTWSTSFFCCGLCESLSKWLFRSGHQRAGVVIDHFFFLFFLFFFSCLARTPVSCLRQQITVLSRIARMKSFFFQNFQIYITTLRLRVDRRR